MVKRLIRYLCWYCVSRLLFNFIFHRGTAKPDAVRPCQHRLASGILALFLVFFVAGLGAFLYGFFTA